MSRSLYLCKHMQTPGNQSGTSSFFKSQGRHRRLKTTSESRQTYKPSSLLIDCTRVEDRRSPLKYKVLYEKPAGERRTRKKVCNNPVAYFRTLPSDVDASGLEELLSTELFGTRMDDHVVRRKEPSPDESMEIVNLKNSSLDVSKVFGSRLY